MSATTEKRALNRAAALALLCVVAALGLLAIGGGPDWLLGAAIEELPESSRLLGLAGVAFAPLWVLDRETSPRFPVAALAVGLIVSVIVATVALLNVLSGGLGSFGIGEVAPLLACGFGCSGLALTIRLASVRSAKGTASVGVLLLWLVPPALWWLAMELSRNPIAGLANLSPPVALLNDASLVGLVVPGVVGWGWLAWRWLRILRRTSRRSGRPMFRKSRRIVVASGLFMVVCVGLGIGHGSTRFLVAQPAAGYELPGSFEARFLTGDYRRADEHLPMQLTFSGALPTAVAISALDPGSGLKVSTWSMRIVEPREYELLPVFLPARCSRVRVVATYGQGRTAIPSESLISAPPVSWNREGGRWMVGVVGELPSDWRVETTSPARSAVALIPLPTQNRAVDSEQESRTRYSAPVQVGRNAPPGLWTWQALACFDVIVVSSEEDRSRIGADTLARYMTSGGRVISFGTSAAEWERSLAYHAGTAITPREEPGLGWRATYPADVSKLLPKGLVFRDSHAAGPLWVVSDARAVANELSEERLGHPPLFRLLELMDGGGDATIGPPIHVTAQSGLFHTHGEPQFAKRAAVRWRSLTSWWLAALLGGLSLVWLVVPVGWPRARVGGMIVVASAGAAFGAVVSSGSQPPIALASTILSGAGGQGATLLTQWMATPGAPDRGAFSSAMTPHAWPTRIANSQGGLALLRDPDGVWTVAATGDTRIRVDVPTPSFALRTVAATVRGKLLGARSTVVQGAGREELPANLLQDRVRDAHGQSAADLSAAWVEQWGWARHRLGFSLVPIGVDEGGLWHTEPLGPPLVPFDSAQFFSSPSSEYANAGPREWPEQRFGRQPLRLNFFGVDEEPLGASRWAPGVGLMWWPLP